MHVINENNLRLIETDDYIFSPTSGRFYVVRYASSTTFTLQGEDYNGNHSQPFNVQYDTLYGKVHIYTPRG